MAEQYINIMTSCDETLARQLPVTLQSIHENITTGPVNFYLFHTTISEGTIKRLEKLCSYYGNIFFHEIVISDTEKYLEIAKYGGGWCAEAYYSLRAQDYLPLEMERILYLDAGDTLVVKDIDSYYFSDFDDKSLVVTAGRFKGVNMQGQLQTYETEDLWDLNLLPGILCGVFNSGSYVINLNKSRIDGYTLDDYIYLAKSLAATLGRTEKVYIGDQGLLSAAFLGDVKYYAYPQIADLWNMPYDFGVWYFERMNSLPTYDIHIIHFSGVPFKPWNGKYPIFLKEFQTQGKEHMLNELKIGQAEYYYLWHEYAIKADEALNHISK